MEHITTSAKEGKQDDEQNRVWENNQKKILEAISEATKYCDSHIPTVTELSKATGLSRQTVYQHFKNSSTHPAYRQRSEMFESMQIEVLMQICRSAMRGDLQAAKLYLELTGRIQAKETTSKAVANNNIQINGMVLNQQIMQALSPEQLKKIEDIIKSATAQETVLVRNPEEATG